MRITWVTRSFLDYRIPIYKEIDRLCGHQLRVIYFKDIVPDRCQLKLNELLGERAIALSGELRLGGKKIENQQFANSSGIRIPLRPGLIAKVKSTKPDMLLSDGFFQWTYAALVNNALFGIPHIMCYERTLHTERNVSKLRAFSRKLASKYIDAICCNGIQTKEYLVQFGYPASRLFMGNMAADSIGLQLDVNNIQATEIEEIRNKYNLKQSVFLFVGQLIERKGIFPMLNAWKSFAETNKTSTLVLLGGGDLTNEAIDFIKNNNLDSIKLLGKVDYSEVAKFYASADIFLIPTLEDNWSLVVPEAMACGLPILCSTYNGCWPELVKPDNGWVFDPFDAANFLSVLQRSWENRDNWKQMGEESLKIVADYSPEKVAGRIFNACEVVVNLKH